MTLPASWEICMQVKKQQLEPDMEQWTGSKLGKKYVKTILSPCLFNLYAEYIIGRTDAEAETPTLWSPDEKNWLTGKDPDAGKDWRWEENGMTEDEMVGWHHRLDGHEFE